jgi:hypothetical protein
MDIILASGWGLKQLLSEAFQIGATSFFADLLEMGLDRAGAQV